jgi:hypothetical protein
MWNLKVPKICHFYWGGSIMIYMRYLSIKTFIKFNPDWQVIFWYPKDPFKGRSWFTDMYPPKIEERLCKDYFHEVLNLNITHIQVDFQNLGINKEMSEVHKNDYIRLNSLYLYGGAWSDTDIIYFQPMIKLMINNPGNKDKEVFVCISNYGHSTGFNLAIPEADFFNTLMDNMNHEYHPRKYQCWGPDMWNKYFRKLNSISNGAEIGKDAVYAHDIHDVNDLLSIVNPRFTEYSIGCHWYGGHQQWPEFFNKTGGGEHHLPKCLISNLIKNAQ